MLLGALLADIFPLDGCRTRWRTRWRRAPRSSESSAPSCRRLATAGTGSMRPPRSSQAPLFLANSTLQAPSPCPTQHHRPLCLRPRPYHDDGDGGDRRGLHPSSSLFLSSLELSDTTLYEPSIRALLGTSSHFCQVAVLKLRAVPSGTDLNVRTTA